MTGSVYVHRASKSSTLRHTNISTTMLPVAVDGGPLDPATVTYGANIDGEPN